MSRFCCYETFWLVLQSPSFVFLFFKTRSLYAALAILRLPGWPQTHQVLRQKTCATMPSSSWSFKLTSIVFLPLGDFFSVVFIRIVSVLVGFLLSGQLVSIAKACLQLDLQRGQGSGSWEIASLKVLSVIYSAISQAVCGS